MHYIIALAVFGTQEPSLSSRTVPRLHLELSPGALTRSSHQELPPACEAGHLVTYLEIEA